jgi:hypothetical protein
MISNLKVALDKKTHPIVTYVGNPSAVLPVAKVVYSETGSCRLPLTSQEKCRQGSGNTEK